MGELQKFLSSHALDFLTLASYGLQMFVSRRVLYRRGLSKDLTQHISNLMNGLKLPEPRKRDMASH